MLYINPASPNIFVAHQQHKRWSICFVNKKIGANKCSDNTCPICNSRHAVVTRLNPRIKSFLTSGTNLDRIISGNPNELELVNRDFWNHVYTMAPYATIQRHIKKSSPASIRLMTKAVKTEYRRIHKIVKQISEILNYQWLTNVKTKPYNAYNLATALDRYTCSYCNRLYTSTVITSAKKLVTRPTLDHWFPKSEYPLLAISFYNLVPSCYSCNSSVKGSANLSLATHIHPYIDATQTGDFYFDYAYTAMDGYRISIHDTPNGIANASKAKKTLNEMFLNEVYNSNVSELRDLLIIKKNYSKSYITIMQGLLKTKLSSREVYRILFGVMYDIQNYHKRPLSKFKYDILKKLGMLDELP